MAKIGHFLLLVCFCSGCAHVISQEKRATADQNITFVELLANPDRYLGKKMVVGGIIVSVDNGNAGGHLQIVQTRLDKAGIPGSVDETEGRFLARSGSYLDPSLYRKGVPVTLYGEVTGSTILPLDQSEYRYPELRIEEIHLWYKQDEELLPASTPATDPYHWGHDTPYYWNFRPTGQPWRLW